MSKSKTLLSEADDFGGASAQQRHFQIVGNVGTALSNTVPSTCIDTPDSTILRTGIDSLYLSYPGELALEPSIKLAKCKELAQAPDAQASALAQIELGSHLFEVGDKGRSIYPFVLRDAWYTLQISKRFAVNKPLAFAIIASSLLTTKSLPFILSDLADCIKPLGPVTGEPNLSRVDLCCDFVTRFPLDQIKDSHWLTRARSIARYTESKQFTGFAIGMGGPLSARLYNKSVELKNNPRPYLETLWKDAGWNGVDEVWRLEFQFQREALKQFGAFTVNDLETVRAGLWRYASHDWLRLVVPSASDTTPSRWPLASVWTTLQGASWTGEPSLARMNLDKLRVPSDKQLFENGLSSLTSFMALHGLSMIEDGVKAYMKAANYYHARREHFTGTDFQGYITGKIRIKQRQFNSAVNVPAEGIHPVDNAIADAYRRARDGE